ncbi:hypothetical protein [Saccharopolyspora pogona]|uniref:hypothetical protein n=1 Tax=Saccharopolyspora pogona TaxID=333966 RepID=UPI00168728A8|nr:hypothetical protein [Saccharopolyspora pogona]
MILLGLFQNPSAYLAVIGAFVVVAGVLAVIPIRGGTGQHAGAGPGAVMVWQLSEALEAERKVRLARPRIPAISIEIAAGLRVPAIPPGSANYPLDSAIPVETADDPWPEEEIRWPEEPVAEYVGRHRLMWDIDERPRALSTSGSVQVSPGQVP